MKTSGLNTGKHPRLDKEQSEKEKGSIMKTKQQNHSIMKMRKKMDFITLVKLENKRNNIRGEKREKPLGSNVSVNFLIYLLCYCLARLSLNKKKFILNENKEIK